MSVEGGRPALDSGPPGRSARIVWLFRCTYWGLLEAKKRLNDLIEDPKTTRGERSTLRKLLYTISAQLAYLPKEADGPDRISVTPQEPHGLGGSWSDVPYAVTALGVWAGTLANELGEMRRGKFKKRAHWVDRVVRNLCSAAGRTGHGKAFEDGFMPRAGDRASSYAIAPPIASGTGRVNSSRSKERLIDREIEREDERERGLEGEAVSAYPSRTRGSGRAMGGGV